MTRRDIGRSAKGLLWILAAAGLLWAYRAYLGALPGGRYLTGWVLFGLMFALAAYNGRKKIPFLPAGTSRGWLQFHIYAGLFSVLLFLLHLNGRTPTSEFGGTLAGLYAIVAGSGVAGVFISRILPRRLTARGGEVPFDAIPVARRRLQERAEKLALDSIPAVNASTVADFYDRRLAEFFAGPQHFWAHVLELRAPLNRLLMEMSDQNRYLNERERHVMTELADLVRRKDGLDYHRALQLVLRLWLFVHIPLTYALLIFCGVHVAVVYAFSGGAR